jgi:predicted alpha/beta hydrolase family esterase
MPPRAFIIHGYLSDPQEAWLPWLARQLEQHGYQVIVPHMPHPTQPRIDEWINFISAIVGQPDDDTVLIGHSIGCQGVLRYLETIGAQNLTIAKTVLVAGMFPTGMSSAAAWRSTEGDPNLVPWFESSIDPAHVKRAMGQCTVLLSDNDPYLNTDEVALTFRATINPKIICVPGKGHFNEDDHLTELPEALDAVLAP